MSSSLSLLARTLVRAESSKSNFVDLSVPGWAWVALIVFIAILLAVDILVIHRNAHEVHIREAAIESVVWVGLGLTFTGVIAWMFAGQGQGSAPQWST